MAREPPVDSDAQSTDSTSDAADGGADAPPADRDHEATVPADTDRDAETDPATDTDRGSVGDATVSFDDGGRREVELPLRLYKTVTVFSTLIAVVCVVVGFLLFDAATLGASLLRRFVTGAFAALGVGVAEGTLSALFAIAGLLAIAFGAVVYIVGTRFRAPGMTGERADRDE